MPPTGIVFVDLTAYGSGIIIIDKKTGTYDMENMTSGDFPDFILFLCPAVIHTVLFKHLYRSELPYPRLFIVYLATEQIHVRFPAVITRKCKDIAFHEFCTSAMSQPHPDVAGFVHDARLPVVKTHGGKPFIRVKDVMVSCRGRYLIAALQAIQAACPVLERSQLFGL